MATVKINNNKVDNTNIFSSSHKPSGGQNIVSFTAEQAKNFFMSSERYCTATLPESITFDSILKEVEERIGDTPYKECVGHYMPHYIDNVNMDMAMHKNKRYELRPLVLANPFLYYFLVREMCQEKNWKSIGECLDAYRTPHIHVSSLPLYPMNNEKFHNSTTILGWWKGMEQLPLFYSAQYTDVISADLSNCYGSIKHDAIDWALACKGTKQETGKNRELAKSIKLLLRGFMRNSVTGIPQGSVLFDFIAEIVLGYSDLLLAERLEEEGISDYEICRYRDDYRIIGPNKQHLMRILDIMAEVLRPLGFSFNVEKTNVLDNNKKEVDTSLCPENILKPAKYELINNPFVVENLSEKKHLEKIRAFAKKFPNCGQLYQLLAEFNERIVVMPDNNTLYILEDPEQVIDDDYTINIRVMINNLVGMLEENPSKADVIMQVIRTLLTKLEHYGTRRDAALQVYNRLSTHPNSYYLKIWLQTITREFDIKDGIDRYQDVSLCRVISGEKCNIWNNSWLLPEFSKGFHVTNVVDIENLNEADPDLTVKCKVSYDNDAENE